jgi:hypothetical protein
MRAEGRRPAVKGVDWLEARQQGNWLVWQDNVKRLAGPSASRMCRDAISDARLRC